MDFPTKDNRSKYRIVKPASTLRERPPVDIRVINSWGLWPINKTVALCTVKPVRARNGRCYFDTNDFQSWFEAGFGELVSNSAVGLPKWGI